MDYRLKTTQFSLKVSLPSGVFQPADCWQFSKLAKASFSPFVPVLLLLSLHPQGTQYQVWLSTYVSPNTPGSRTSYQIIPQFVNLPEDEAGTLQRDGLCVVAAKLHKWFSIGFLLLSRCLALALSPLFSETPPIWLSGRLKQTLMQTFDHSLLPILFIRLFLFFLRPSLKSLSHWRIWLYLWILLSYKEAVRRK